MKIILTCIVLLSSLQYAFADTTLTFADALKNTLTPSLTYSIKDKQLKLTQSGQNTINVYNRKDNTFVSFNTETGKSAQLNEQILNKRVSQLNKERLQKLAKVQKELPKEIPNMTPAQQAASETLVNLYKYPEYYGEHTSLIVRKSDNVKQVNGMACQPYQLYKIDRLLKSFCMAEADALNMSDTEYKTLRSFYAFNYSMQSRLLIALGDTKFTIIDYDQHNMPGVVVEEIEYQKSTTSPPKVSHHNVLKNVHHQPISSVKFDIPPSPVNKPE